MLRPDSSNPGSRSAPERPVTGSGAGVPAVAVSGSAAPVSAASGAAATQPALPSRLIRRLVDGLPSGLVVLDADGAVVLANPAARSMGVIDGGRLALDELSDLVGQTRADGVDRDRQLGLPPRPEPPLTRPRPDQEAFAVRARTLRLGADGHVAVILDDVTEARRVEAVRRDFVANVSHELKTPVGALHVLAEAVAVASDDPVAVRRFASRMTRESSRLARLVQEIIDLSRLQGADPKPDPRPVRVSAVLAEALDRTRLTASAREITIAVIGDSDFAVSGDEGQLATALANLLDNAVSYSPTGTRVVIGVRRAGDTVELSVADEGIGIAERDLERVFERFYRADPARSRQTGGTGLGLAIVKHVATNHGGSVSVWSAEGAGSTFTIRLPLLRTGGDAGGETDPDPDPDPDTDTDTETDTDADTERGNDNDDEGA